MAPLRNVANHGVPVFIVPGNHERSRIPLQLWTSHPNIHIFDKPRTYGVEVKGVKLGFSGFPFARKIRDQFRYLIGQTGFREIEADVRFLCIHQAVEGSKVGPSDYTFRRGPDVLRGRDLPEGFAAILAGHIHRGQILTRDLQGQKIAAPVIYPGSIERTSFAERYEEKSYVILKIERTRNKNWETAEIFF
ncbi:exonuclease SbcCD subunit D [Chloroflexota bacterium]